MPANLTIRVEQAISVPAAQVAELFWTLHSDEQAEFFNELSRLSAGKLCMQMALVGGDGLLSREGRDAMETIGGHAHDECSIAAEACPDGLLPDGERCPRCGAERGPSGVDGGSWVHIRKGAN